VFGAALLVASLVIAGLTAGLATVQNESHGFFLGVRLHGLGSQVLLERSNGANHAGGFVGTYIGPYARLDR
jgi:hypothetical protein